MPPPAVSLGMELRVGQRGCDAPATADSELSLCLEPVTRGHSSVSLAGPQVPRHPPLSRTLPAHSTSLTQASAL